MIRAEPSIGAWMGDQAVSKAHHEEVAGMDLAFGAKGRHVGRGRGGNSITPAARDDGLALEVEPLSPGGSVHTACAGMGSKNNQGIAARGSIGKESQNLPDSPRERQPKRAILASPRSPSSCRRSPAQERTEDS